MRRPDFICGLLLAAASPAAAQTPFPGNDHSYAISASRDLRYVAFASNASNLVAGDTNGRPDVYVADRTLGTLRRVSVDVNGIQGDGTSVWPSISGDGRYVAFDTDATNLGVGTGLVRKDLVTGAIVLVAANVGVATSFPSLSDDGAYATSDPAGFIRFHDIGAGTTTNITSITPPSFFDDAHPMISGDGRYVFFASNRTNLVGDDTNGVSDIYRWDRTAPGSFQRVSLGSGGVEANGATPTFLVGGRVTNAARPLATSFDGNLIAFYSQATNLTVDPGGLRAGLFVRNITTGAVTKLAACSPCSGISAFDALDFSADGAHLSLLASGEFVGGVPSATQLAGYYVVQVATGTFSTLGDLGPGRADIFAHFSSAIADGGVAAAIQTTVLPAGVDDRARYADVLALTLPGIPTTLLSRAGRGRAGDGHSRQPALSDSGRRAVFASDAGNLVVGDSNAYRDVFLRDLTTDTIALVSSGTGGAPANGASGTPSISGDGNVVAFGSEADNLVAGDTPGSMDVFVRDGTGTIERMSAGLASESDGQVSGYSGLSQDGRHVAIATRERVYLLDRVTQVRTLASPTVDNLAPNPNCNVCEAFRLSLSDDGRYVVFNGRAENHVVGQASDFEQPDIFLFDSQNFTLELVGRATGAAGVEASGTNVAPWISGDGRYVAWWSDAANLGPPNRPGIRLRDRVLNTTVFVGGSPRPGNFIGMEAGPILSRDGDYVAFLSTLGDVVPGDSNRLADLFLWQRASATTRRISLSAAWSQANGSSYAAEVSPQVYPRFFGAGLSRDGTIAAFSSAATNLSARDENASDDIFVVDRDSQAIARVSAAPLAPLDDDRTAPVATADAGSAVMVLTDRSGALRGSPSVARAKGFGDKFTTVVMHEFTTNTDTQIDVSSTGAPANGDSFFPAVAPLASVASFASDATNLGASTDANASTDVFVRDTTTDTTVSITAGADADSGRSATTSIGDKWSTAFESNATNLPAAASPNGAQDVFIAIEAATENTFTIEPVSVALGGGSANGPSGAPSLSADARFVAYSSLATNLVASDANGVSDVFVRDRTTAATSQVSLGQGGAPNGASGQVAIVGTPGNTWVATFESEASNLIAGDSNADTDVFVRTSGNTTELISRGLGGSPANGKSLNPSISPDGQFVTFTSTASNLVPGDSNNLPDVFLFDRVALTTRRISVGLQGQQADDYALRPSIGQNGGASPVVVWDSAAENLLPGDEDQALDVFRYDSGSDLFDSTDDRVFRNGFE